AAPHYYSAVICLATYATDETLSRFSADARPRFLCGALEPFVASGDLTRRLARIRRTGCAVEEATIPGADHFFLLTHPRQTVEQLRRWTPATAAVAAGSP